MFRILPRVFGIVALAAIPGLASAADMIGLSTDGKLVPIDGMTWKAGKAVDIQGVDGKLLGIDFRPADGALYGVSDSGAIYTIGREDGLARKVSTLSERFEPGRSAVVDFNPVADRLRLMDGSSVNFRVNVDDGKVAVDKPLRFAADGADGKPMVIAGAYTNSVAGTKSTELFDIEAATGALLLQAPPNDGMLQTRGKLGGVPTAQVAFDILSDGKGGNQAYLVAGGKVHTVDLGSGKASAVGEIQELTHTLTDIAVYRRR